MALWCGKHQRSTGYMCQQPQKVQCYTYLLTYLLYLTLLIITYFTLLACLRILIKINNFINSSSGQWEDIIDEMCYRGTCSAVYIKFCCSHESSSGNDS